MPRLVQRLFFAAALLIPASAPAEPPTTAPAADPSNFYLLHLPGIAGNRSIDRAVIHGVRDGGFSGVIEIYDWTDNDPGLDALLARARNSREAQHVADILSHQVATRPPGSVDLICHSGGGGIAVWALEDLAPGAQIHDAVLMSPALSPQYDLSKALTHVSGKVYVFTSLADLLVLGTGTRWFGTIDGVKTDAAGRVGFTRPAGADPQQYRKLVQLPFDPSWTRYGDFGDHRGGMTRSFGQNVLAPLLLNGTLPPTAEPLIVETPTGLGRAATTQAAPEPSGTLPGS